jgi:thymidylate synthase
MQNYKDLISNILQSGESRNERTGTGTLSLFSPPELRFDLSKEFPLLNLRKVSFHSILTETLWFLSGKCDNTDYLKKHKVTIWDEWADNGYLGNIYGLQWRNWQGRYILEEGHTEYYDQIAKLIHNLQSNPTSRRHIVSAWNVAELDDMALPPCHWAFQCYVSNENKLSLKLFLRSADVYLGTPYNIAGYAIITHILANICGLQVGELIVNLGDAHLYKNHLEQSKEILERETLQLPTFEITKQLTLNDLDNLEPDKELFKLSNYISHSKLNAPISV